MVERRFPRDIGALPAIFDFIADFGSCHGIGEDCRYDVDLIVEELFTNMVKYNHAGSEEIRLGFDRQGTTLTIRLRDIGVEAFDMTANAPPAGDTKAGELSTGGRGLHLVRQYADDIRYDYHDRNSTITVTKRLAP
ncbi:MAG: ATP-binding protein [Candidatus Eisenbacteria bacterium]|nr:ATP-binding protein [Candidatus Eisenbacteria bacterium]